MRLLMVLIVMRQLNAGSVSGVVRNSVTNEPVAGAKVGLAPSTQEPNVPFEVIYCTTCDWRAAEKYTVLTDGDGRFQVADLPAGIYQIVEARAERFAMVHLPSGKPYRYDAAFELGAAQHIPDFELFLQPESVVRGQVRFGGRNPVSLVIRARSEQRDPVLRKTLFKSGEAFDFRGLSDADHILAATPHYGIWSKEPAAGERPQGPQPVRLDVPTPPGETRLMDVALPMGPLYRVKAVLAAPAPLESDATCVVTREIEGGILDRYAGECKVAADSIQIAWLPSGNYRVEVGSAKAKLVGWSRFEITNEDIDLLIRPRTRRSVQFVFRSAEPARDIVDFVTLETDEPVSVAYEESWWVGPNVLEFRGVVPAEFRLEVRFKTSRNDVRDGQGRISVDGLGGEPLRFEIDCRREPVR